jgi:thymidylate synthase (FAD)
MKIIQPKVIIENQDWTSLLKKIETKGRVCYKSEDRITGDSAEKFIGILVRLGHLSVLEHEKISAKFLVDRGVSHEIVRHRLASYSQESTRYCNYGAGEVVFIEPFFLPKNTSAYDVWYNACLKSELSYKDLTNVLDCSPQEARTVLNNSLKTELWMTANIREWLHFFSLRTAKPAHPQMRQVAIPLLLKMQELLPSIFGSMGYDKDFPTEHYAEVICG